jgi:hypothetical protein
LANEYDKSRGHIRARINRYVPTEKIHTPRALVLAIDATFWGKANGVIVARDPNERENLYVEEVTKETPDDYRKARRTLETLGYAIQGVVIDGKRGVREVFSDMPVQHCQFHQIKTVTKYLTRRPKTQAGWELRGITLTLARTTEREFTDRLNMWHERWQTFLSERTPCSCCKEKRWPYTHRKLRAAHRSLKTNLPFLFTYQRYPELHLPNTTNTLDGSFSHLKGQVGLHRGKKAFRRYKIIQEILKNAD